MPSWTEVDEYSKDIDFLQEFYESTLGGLETIKPYRRGGPQSGARERPAPQQICHLARSKCFFEANSMVITVSVNKQINNNYQT